MSHTDIATRAFVVALKSVGCKTTAETAMLTYLSHQTINNIYAEAIRRGFDPHQRPLTLRDEHVRDKPRSGRPTKQSDKSIEKPLSLVRYDRYGRERTCADFSASLYSHSIKISASTVHRILRKLVTGSSSRLASLD